MLLDNSANYLQRSINTLRTLGDRLGERNVDLRLNLHQDLRNNDHLRLNCDRNLNNGLELNLSLNSERMQQERMHQQERIHHQQESIHHHQQERLQQERSLNLERIINERNLNERIGLDHMDRLSLERSLQQQNMDRVALTDRNLNNVDRMLANENNRASDRLRSNFDMQNEISDIKYREYKAHLDSLRSNESSRPPVEGRPPPTSEGGQQQEERGTSSTPPTPLSVGENFQEEKVFCVNFFFVVVVRLAFVVSSLRIERGGGRLIRINLELNYAKDIKNWR